MARAIPYIDTGITANKSIAEIEDVIAAHAKDVSLLKRVEGGRIKSVAFQIDGADYIMPGRVEQVYERLLNEKLRQANGASYRTSHEKQAVLYAQAERCAWRNVLMHVKSTLAMVEIGMTTITEVFMPYRLTDSGETAYERLMAGGLPALMAPGGGNVTH